MSRFETRMTWNGSGNGHWDVVLTEMTNGRARLLATIPLDEWISLGDPVRARTGGRGRWAPEADGSHVRKISPMPTGPKGEKRPADVLGKRRFKPFH